MKNYCVLNGKLVPFPFVQGSEPLTEDAPLPRDAKGFPELAAGLPTYDPPGACDPLDLAELTRQASLAAEKAVETFTAAGMRAATLPGRLDVLPWVVEYIAAGLVAYDLPMESAYDVLENALPDYAKHYVESALSKAYAGTFFEPGTASKATAAARVARDAARKAQREAMALRREEVARKVTDATPAKLGCHVVRWLVSGDRAATVMTSPGTSALATPFFLRGGLDVSDGTTLFAVAPVQSAGLTIRGKVAGPDWELVGANETLPGEFTGAQWQAAQHANKSLPAGLWSVIVQARKASTDLGPMAPDGGLDENSFTGRAAIALGIERLRMMKAANVNLFNGPSGPGDQAILQRDATIEWLARGLDLNVLVCRDILLEGKFGDSEPIDYSSTADWFVRLILKARSEGTYLAAGECLPKSTTDEVVSSGDAFQDVLAPLCAGRDEVLKSDVELALRSAGVANVVTNIFSGRCTRTMQKLGFAKETLFVDGKAQRGYRRIGAAPVMVAPVVSPTETEMQMHERLRREAGTPAHVVVVPPAVDLDALEWDPE